MHLVFKHSYRLYLLFKYRSCILCSPGAAGPTVTATCPLPGCSLYPCHRNMPPWVQPVSLTPQHAPFPGAACILVTATCPLPGCSLYPCHRNMPPPHRSVLQHHARAGQRARRRSALDCA